MLAGTNSSRKNREDVSRDDIVVTVATYCGQIDLRGPFMYDGGKGYRGYPPGWIDIKLSLIQGFEEYTFKDGEGWELFTHTGKPGVFARCDPPRIVQTMYKMWVATGNISYWITHKTYTQLKELMQMHGFVFEELDT